MVVKVRKSGKWAWLAWNNFTNTLELHLPLGDRYESLSKLGVSDVFVQVVLLDGTILKVESLNAPTPIQET